LIDHIKANLTFITVQEPAIRRVCKTMGEEYWLIDVVLYYFGHSQGTTQMFVALTDEKTREFFNKRVKRFFALAPIVF